MLSFGLKLRLIWSHMSKACHRIAAGAAEQSSIEVERETGATRDFSQRGTNDRIEWRADALATMKTALAIYPGSFDPVTNGHLDLIERGTKIFDRLVVAVLRNSEKDPMFTTAERVEMLREATKQWENVEVDVFDGLLVQYARQRKAQVILRGIRAISDYEYELQMALMNRKLEPHIETVFMMPAEAYSYLSSRLVREISNLGGTISGLVPPTVEARLKSKSQK